MDQLNSIRAFVKVAEAGSFARAADLLDLSVPRVSRLIGELEGHLGIRLLQRTTRKMSLTESGRLYLERCRPILHDLDDIQTQVAADALSVSGRLRLVAPVQFAIQKLGPVLAAYREAHPKVTIDLVLADRAVDLVQEGYDLAIQAARHVTGLSLISRHLTTTDFYTCAAPAYLAAHGSPEHPRDLAQHPYLAFRTEHGSDEIVYEDAGGEPVSVRLHPVFTTNNIGMVRTAALAGMGIATLSAYLADDDIQAGRLVRVLPQYRLADREFRLVYSSRKFLSLKVKAFIDLALVHFGPAG